MKISKGKYLGKLCKRKHEWGNTGKTMRTIVNNSCIKCTLIYNVTYREKNKLLLAKKRRDTWKNREGRIRIKAYKKEYRDRNLERWKKLSYKYSHTKNAIRRNNEAGAKGRETLSDNYIKNSILHYSDAPDWLVELKRIHIKITRLIKERINEEKQSCK